MAVLTETGIKRAFGLAFKPFYSKATLRQRTLSYDTEGTESATTNDRDIRAFRNTKAERQLAASGTTGFDAVLYVLQHGVTTPPNTDDEIVFDGTLWRVTAVTTDGANSHWIAQVAKHG